MKGNNLFWILVFISVFMVQVVNGQISGLRECLPLDNDFVGIREDWNASDGNGVTFNDTIYKLGTYSAFLEGNIGDYIDWGSIPLNVTDGHTIVMWLYPQKEHAFTLMGRTNGNYAKPYQYVFNGDNNSQMFTGTGGSQSIVAQNPLNLDTEQWEFIVYQYKNISGTSNHSYWNDGVLNLTGTQSQKPTDDTGISFEIGRRANEGVGYYGGYIDEVAVFDKWLSRSEILDLYNSGSGRTCDYILNGESSASLTVNTDMSDTKNYNQASLTIGYNGTYSNTNGDYFDCELNNNTNTLQVQNYVNLSQNQFFIIDTSDFSGEYNLSIFCSENANKFNVTTENLVTGDDDGGSYLNMTEEDGVYREIGEVTGSNAIDVYWNFTGVTNPNFLHYNITYSGNPAHNVEIQVYNQTGFEYLSTIQEGNNEDEIDVSDSTFLSSGIMQFRVLHTSSGNTNHYVRIDNFNVESLNVNDTTLVYDYEIDTVNPIILSDFNNNTMFNTSDTVRIYVNFSDDNLFAYNVTVFDPDGVIYDSHQYFTENLTGNFAENLTSFDVGTSDIGNNYTIISSVWDSHTKNKVKPIKLGYGDDWVSIDDYMFIEGITDSYFKLEDDGSKYEFTLYFENESLYQEFYVKSTRSLIYLPNSQYSGHLIYDYQRYIDFNSKDIKNLTVSQVDQGYKFIVELYQEDNTLEIKDSLGDLNFAENRYYFSVQEEVSLSNTLLTSIDGTLDDIYEVIEIIPIVMMYGILLFFGYWLVRSYNFWVGLPFLIATSGFNFYFWTYYDTRIAVISVVFGGLTLGSLVMWLFLNRYTPRNKKFKY